jgi:hypothetical protein
MTVREVKKQIFVFLRPLLRAPDIAQSMLSSMSEEEILDLEYKSYFESSETDTIYKVQIVNNLRCTETGFLYDSRPKCEFCNTHHKDNCDFGKQQDTLN